MKVTEPFRAPFFFGIWTVEGQVVGLDFDIGNTNQCISWTDTDMYADGSVHAAKSFTVWSTIIGCFVCGPLLLLVCIELASWSKEHNPQREQPTAMRLSSRQEMVFVMYLECASVLCALLTALFYNAFGADLCTDNFIGRQITCRWGSGAYFAIGAIVGWIGTALCIGLIILPRLEWQSAFVSTTAAAAATTTNTATTHRGGRQDTSRRRSAREVQDDPVPNNHNNRGSYYPRRHDNAFTTEENTRRERPQGMASADRYEATQSNIREVRNTEQPDVVHETGNKILSNGSSNGYATSAEDQTKRTPSGTPLISISEDSEGNRIRTTVLRYLDENGEEVVEKTTEVLPDDMSEV